ncbi:MAG: hypothetical protein ACR2PL_16380 [Dehalococcoidia bacterium]
MNENGRIEKIRIEVEPGSELDRALAHVEATRGQVELLHGQRSYKLVRLPGPFTEEERARRVALMEQTLADRNRQQPLGITTAELIREGRGEADGG